MKKRQQLHQSGLNMLSVCGLQFQYRYIEGIKRPPNAFLLVGKACDESATQNLQHKIDHHELLQRNEALGVAETAFDQEQSKQPIELDPDEKREGRSLELVLGEARDKSINLSGLHYDQAAPGLHPKLVRRRFSIDMDGFLRARARVLHTRADLVPDPASGRVLHLQASKLNAAARDGMDFAGEIDLQEGYGAPERLLSSVRDLKTSSKSPTKSLMDGADSPGIADDSDQLTGYALAHKVLEGRLPDIMALDYLVQTAGGETRKPQLKYVITKTQRNQADLDTFLNRFANAVQAMRTGMFVPAPATDWRCSEKFCGFWNQCPMAKRPKLVQITQEVPA
jgi:hypothetical protein